MKLLLDPVRPSPAGLRLDVDGRWDGDVLEITQEGFSLAGVLGLREVGATEGSSIPERWIRVSVRKGGE
ncbi:MAG: hypothetical protein IH608_11625, partial [Proteobacteria bacterium]|nr:hypothetical protein [Pseudomonadota bacterium]